MSSTTALDLWQAHALETLVLRSGCDDIDALLRGGFRSGVLTEICGEASAGKTQLCLQLLLQCALPVPLGGLGASACYICTEGIGSIKRLHDLASVYAHKYGSVVASRKRKRQSSDSESAVAATTHTTDSSAPSNAFLDAIFVEQLYEADELLDLLVRLVFCTRAYLMDEYHRSCSPLVLSCRGAVVTSPHCSKTACQRSSTSKTQSSS